MRCPTLSELPSPPPGKACTERSRSAGWPWTEESPQLPDTMPDPSTGLPSIALRAGLRDAPVAGLSAFPVWLRCILQSVICTEEAHNG